MRSRSSRTEASEDNCFKVILESNLLEKSIAFSSSHARFSESVSDQQHYLEVNRFSNNEVVFWLNLCLIFLATNFWDFHRYLLLSWMIMDNNWYLAFTNTYLKYSDLV